METHMKIFRLLVVASAAFALAMPAAYAANKKTMSSTAKNAQNNSTTKNKAHSSTAKNRANNSTMKNKRSSRR